MFTTIQRAFVEQYLVFLDTILELSVVLPYSWREEGQRSGKKQGVFFSEN